MIIFQILLIILVAAPVIILAFYLWLQLADYVRKKNKQDRDIDPSGKGRRK